MSEHYKIRVKSDLFEIELESADREFVENKIDELISLATKSQQNKTKDIEAPNQEEKKVINETSEPKETKIIEEPKPEEKPFERSSNAHSSSNSTSNPNTNLVRPRSRDRLASQGMEFINESDSGIEVDKIIKAIEDSEHYPRLKRAVIDQKDQLNRILLIFYFSNEVYPERTLSNTLIENATELIGNKISRVNIGPKIKTNLDLFKIYKERKQGGALRYQIKIAGLEKFERIIS